MSYHRKTQLLIKACADTTQTLKGEKNGKETFYCRKLEDEHDGG